MFHICSISDSYCDFLRKYDSKVYDNKKETRKHTRKYFGIVMTINSLNYYIPMSSPKNNDYLNEEKTKIKHSTNTIIRMVTKKKGKEILRGTLRISNMIPVPIEEIDLYDVDGETDFKYKDVIKDEIAFLSNNKNANMIIHNANLVYHQKILNIKNISYLQYCCDFGLLEEKCIEWNRVNNIFESLNFIKNKEDLFDIYDNMDDNFNFEEYIKSIDIKNYNNHIS